MVQALTGLRRMARPGGYVVIDSRNWEKLHAEDQPEPEQADRPSQQGGALQAPDQPRRAQQPRCGRGVPTPLGE
jgi:hypothetical protein